MSARNEHLIVIAIEPLPSGEFEIWPLHITVVPWFPCDDSQRLDEILYKVAKRHKPIKVRAGRIEEWGNKKKFRVLRVEDDGTKLYQLHWDIFRSLENNGFPIHQKNFLGQKFRPHSALRNRLQQNPRYSTGDEIEIKNFTLVKQVRLKGTGAMIKTVAKEYPLG